MDTGFTAAKRIIDGNGEMGDQSGWFERYVVRNPEAVSLLLWLLAGGAFVYLLKGVITPILFSIIASYLMNIVIRRLEDVWHWRHSNAVGVVFVCSWGVLLGAGFWLVPLLVDQLYHLIVSIPKFVDYLRNSWVTISTRLPDTLLENGSSKLLWNYLTDYVAAVGNSALSLFMDSLRSLGNILFYLVVIPIFSYFLLRDRDLLLNWLTQFWPKRKEQLDVLWQRVQIDLLGYLRGKILEMMLVIGIAAMFFAIFGLRYAILLAVLLGISVFIPYVGIVVVSCPVMVVALLQWGIGMRFGCFLALYTLFNILEGQLLAPVLLARTLALHPLTIILAVFCFGYWFGFWGVLLAIPLTALLRLLLVEWPSARVG